MTRVTLDQATLAKLHSDNQRVSVCDESGRIVGYFAPLVCRSLSDPDVNVPFTDEELDRFANEPGGRRLSEILCELDLTA